MVGDIHACEVVAQTPSHFSKIINGLRVWLETELIIRFGEPPPEYKQYSVLVLKNCLRREGDMVRGRLPHGTESESLFNGFKGQAGKEAACEKILMYWNGDIRKEVSLVQKH